MKRILLVEDDQWLGECYQQWLVGAGYTVRWVRDSQAALDALDDEPTDLIVLDLLLPYANGVQLLQVIASRADFLSTPVIVCSSALPAHAEWQAYGVVAALDKTTLTPARLRAAVQEALHAVVAH